MAEFVAHALFLGIGATLVMDLWALLLRHAFSIPSLDYAMVGRWLGHFLHGRFAHQSIAAAAPVAGERLLGWAAHYAIGVAFAGLLLLIWGLDWAHRPTMLPALVIGVGTILFPILLMQPAFGLGVAAARTPKPNQARLRSLATHTAFAIGLYASARLGAMLAIVP